MSAHPRLFPGTRHSVDGYFKSAGWGTAAPLYRRYTTPLWNDLQTRGETGALTPTRISAITTLNRLKQHIRSKSFVTTGYDSTPGFEFVMDFSVQFYMEIDGAINLNVYLKSHLRIVRTKRAKRAVIGICSA